MDYEKFLKYADQARGVYGTGPGTPALNTAQYGVVPVLDFKQTSPAFLAALYKDPSTGQYRIAIAGTNDVKGNGAADISLAHDEIKIVTGKSVDTWHPEMTDALNFSFEALKRVIARAAFKLARWIAVFAACGWTTFAMAQDPRQTGERMLTDAEVKAKYQNCPNGYYSGPQPGKARYTKDNFIWAVTPEFARKFCMPKEFVSSELKGAEAVAFRIVEDADEERCGWGGRAEVCARMKELRFEIYLKSGALPKERDVPYFQAAKLPSRLLVSVSESERSFKNQSVKVKPRLGAIGPFETSQFGLDGFKDKQVVWPIAGLYAELYYEEVFKGIDYIALQGLTGFFTNPRMEKLDVRRFAIVVDKLGDQRRNESKRMDEFAHVIELPESFTDKVRAADKARGMNVEELGKRALGIKP